MSDSVWCEFVGGPFDGQTKEIPDLPEYLIPSQMTAEAFLAILQGSRPGAEQKFRLYRYRREGRPGKMVYSGPK
jgi:hypothetical protein